MRKTKVSNLVVGEGEEKRVVGIKVETHDDEFTIPVVDVRVSPEQRKRAERILKASRTQTGSKFMKPSYSMMGYSYNVSRKD